MPITAVGMGGWAVYGVWFLDRKIGRIMGVLEERMEEIEKNQPKKER